jgi:hypothetical protein
MNTQRNKNYFYYDIIKPYDFLEINLNNNLDISEIIGQISGLLPQYSSFISQFDTLIIQSGVNVITDSAGNVAIDVPNTMSDIETTNISKRISIIDRLINTHSNSLHDLFKKGLSIEEQLKKDNPNYASQISEKLIEFNKLKAKYKH